MASDADTSFLVDIAPRLNTAEELNELLEAMISHGGSDLFLMSGSPVWASIHGRKRQLTRRRLSNTEVLAILGEAYGTNIHSRLGEGRPVDFSYEFTRSGEEDGAGRSRFRFRGNAVGAIRRGQDSITATFRTIPTTPPSVSELGIEPEILDVCRNTDQGLILVVGATGNGKSTTLAAVLRDKLEDPEGHCNLVTVEAPIEFVYDQIDSPSGFFTQSEVGRHVPSFADGVVNSLRMAPNVILIGEARDYETVSAAVEASMTGHEVFSTVHANSVSETVRRLVAVYPEDMQSMAQLDLVESLRLIVAQRLLPAADGRRVAVREYLVFDHQVRQALRQTRNLAEATEQMVAQHGRPMLADVEAKLAAGLITEAVAERQRANYFAGVGAS